ncbi:MAG: S41 family peptidase [Bacteroidia bacterium]|nr:S41 family peptidase [Bacteroidia bacterium]
MNNLNTPWYKQIILPVLFALITISTLLIGYYTGKNDIKKGNQWIEETQENNKIGLILDYIQDNYVDSVNTDELQNDAIAALLHQLDPHSDFIPAQEFSGIKEQMEGNFEGIGIEFNIIKDTIRVIQTISNGPSEKAGLQAGDKIVYINDTLVAGIHITNEKVFKKLRGKKGTKVKVGIKRNQVKEILNFIIERDEIPLYSIDTYYMIKENIGYIRIDRFAQNTLKEFENAMQLLLKKGMKKLILDLRDNPGGVLDAAVKIADHFLPEGTNIVYTQGRKYPKKIFKATSEGLFESQPLVVLIDEGSASASEIVAGAIQDNDRGIIIGRRSFGKGLVQEQLDLPDGSAIRLTVAKYYTPTGRCIQKPYKKKDMASYYMEEYERYLNGEVIKLDSTKIDTSQKFYTPKGKVVYGGGGIVPDIFVPADTNIHNAKLNKLLLNGCLQQYAFNIADNERKSILQMFSIAQAFIEHYSIDDKRVQDMLIYCKKDNSLNFNAKEMNKIKTLLKAYIGRIIYGNSAYYPILNNTDPTIEKSVLILKETKEL